MSKSRNRKLSKLRGEERAAFRRREQAHKQYMDARKRAEEAYDEVQMICEGNRLAKEAMNREYELARQNSKQERANIWAEYRRLCKDCEGRIEYLRYEMDAARDQMMECLEQEQEARKRGSRYEMILWETEGQDHADCREALRVEMEELRQYVEDKRADAKRRAAEVCDTANLQAAKAEFEKTQRQYKAARIEFEHLRTERECLRAELDVARREHKLAKDNLKELLGV